MNHDRRDEELDATYRRASAAAAGRPDAKTRAAILAEAAAAARRRTPAANAPRYWMRAVAGVAVVGVALLVWRQVDYRPPGEDAAMVAVQGPRAESVGAQSSSPAAANEPQADLAATSSEQPQLKAQQLSDEAADRQRVAEAIEPQPELAEVPVTGARIATAPAPPPAPAVTRSQVLPSFDPAELLRRHFPAQDASDMPQRLWLVLDAAGDVLQQGELAPDESLEDLAPRIAAALGGRSPGAWQQRQLQNAAGQMIELAIARVP